MTAASSAPWRATGARFSAVGVHPLIGYLDFIHLAPAAGGAAVFALGLALTYKPMVNTVTIAVGKSLAPTT